MVTKAKEELNAFFDGIDGPRGIHLYGRPDWDFLPCSEIVSFNAYVRDTVVTYDSVRRLSERQPVSWASAHALRCFL
jgi:hypothetical protein